MVIFVIDKNVAFHLLSDFDGLDFFLDFNGFGDLLARIGLYDH